jgi:hypothetical protein
MIRAMYDLDRITRSDDAWSDHAEVGARATGLGKSSRPALLPHPAAEGGTRDARGGHLKDYVATHAPALTQPSGIDLQPHRGEVLAEETVGQLTSETAFPLVEILTLKRVHGLLIAAVMLSVAYEVPNQPAATTGRLRPRCAHRYRSLGGLLPNACPAHLFVRIGPWVAEIDRVEPCHRVRLQGSQAVSSAAQEGNDVAKELGGNDEHVSTVGIHDQLSRGGPSRPAVGEVDLETGPGQWGYRSQGEGSLQAGPRVPVVEVNPQR